MVPHGRPEISADKVEIILFFLSFPADPHRDAGHLSADQLLLTGLCLISFSSAR